MQQAKTTAQRNIRRGNTWIWFSAAALSLCACTIIGILVLITANGLSHFWPANIAAIEYTDVNDESVLVFGKQASTSTIPLSQYLEAGGSPNEGLRQNALVERWLIKTGNRRLQPPDFRWIFTHRINATSYPAELVSVERVRFGEAIGSLMMLEQRDDSGRYIQVQGGDVADALTGALLRVERIRSEIGAQEKNVIRPLSRELESLRLQRRAVSQRLTDDYEDELAIIAAQEAIVQARFEQEEKKSLAFRQRLQRDQLTLQTASGEQLIVPLAELVSITAPNSMSLLHKVTTFLNNLRRFLLDDPRDANSAGGVFPAIFGTVLMVLLMSVFVTPLGVITAIYLSEYATPGPLLSIIRISVSNLAGVPSIVYGVFGLGFFVYALGGNIDQLFFPEQLPAPTFGTPGIFWASLTLALLTVPVVIVSTEEGLARVPRSLKNGSLALGATRAETLFRITLPMASPAILTGIILAVARAAGEVAPLMLVGVVKFAPTLPVDNLFPYLHLERQFMHLGFHIYDVGFQSSNVEAAAPLAFATALLLMLLVVGLNLLAIIYRSRLESRYSKIAD